MDIKSYLFSFHGRINRAKYLFASLIFLFVMIAFVGLMLMISAAQRPEGNNAMIEYLPHILLGGALFGATTWSWAATTVKRLHDRNKNGWWMIPMFAVPFVLNIVLNWFLPIRFAFPAAGIVAAIGIWSFIETICLRGTKGANRFGPDPLPKTRPLFA